MKIMIVEDNAKIRSELAEYLKRYGYEVLMPDDFKNIINIILEEQPHLVLLDINLPLFDGFYICREVQRASAIPIIIVTSRDSEVDELMCINLGADDFITKPYNTQILLARISAVLKRSYHSDTSITIMHNNLLLDVSKGSAVYNNIEIVLTKNEIKILYILMKNSGKIISRDEVMNELWQSDEFVDDNTLTVNINRLRKKLENAGVANYISTKRGLGYSV